MNAVYFISAIVSIIIGVVFLILLIGILVSVCQTVLGVPKHEIPFPMPYWVSVTILTTLVVSSVGITVYGMFTGVYPLWGTVNSQHNNG